jgi:hypothetical protein
MIEKGLDWAEVISINKLPFETGEQIEYFPPGV